MPLLLVDDRDGRILAELETPEEALSILEAMARDDGSAPEELALVEFHSHQGSVVGTDTSLTIHVLH